MAEPVPDRQMSGLYPDVLPQGSMRLLSIRRMVPELQCDMQTHELDFVKGKYFALSHEWGAEQAPQPIWINGIQVNIQPNLRLALSTLYHHILFDPQSLIWIDAVCLNQQNEAEKEIHVPNMSEIFSRAKKVLVDLGRQADDSHRAFDWIRTAIRGYRRLPEPLSPYNLAGITMPGPTLDREGDPWFGLRALIQRSNFRRLWIWQELIVHTECLIFCGPSWCQIQDLLLFIDLVFQRGLDMNLRDQRTFNARKPPLFLMIMLRQYRERHHRPNFPGEPLPALLNFYRSQEVTKPVDRLWGGLALWPHDVAEHARNNGWIQYSEEAQANYRRSYITLGRFYVVNDPILSFLSYAPSVDKSVHVPSWCPDWHSRQAYEPFSVAWFTVGYENNDARQSNITLVENSDSINVPGASVDRIKSIAIGAWYYDMVDRRQAAHDLLGWEAGCLALARETLHSNPDAIPHEYARTLITDCLDRRSTQVDHDVREDYDRFKRQQLEFENGGVELIFFGDERASMDRYSMAVQAACEGRVFFSTHGGRIGIGPPGIQKGDVVAAFDSASALHIIRKGPGSSILLGDAFVYGLMTQAEVQAAGAVRQIFVID